jgi:hypothetical protein
MFAGYHRQLRGRSQYAKGSFDNAGAAAQERAMRGMADQAGELAQLKAGRFPMAVPEGAASRPAASGELI